MHIFGGYQLVDICIEKFKYIFQKIKILSEMIKLQWQNFHLHLFVSIHKKLRYIKNSFFDFSYLHFNI